jgi:hypothetical protein
VKKLLVVEAADRMSAEEALAHRWIQVDGSSPLDGGKMVSVNLGIV